MLTDPLSFPHKTNIKPLRTAAIFQDLSAAEIEVLERTLTMSSCQKGRIFYRPEDTGEVLFILKQGSVQLYRLVSQSRQIVATITEGYLFGEMPLLGQSMYQTFAEAAADCILGVMTRSDVERLLVENPSVALRVMRAMAERFDNLRAAEDG